MAGLWLAGEVVNHVGIDGYKVADGFLAFERRSCFYNFKTMKTTTFRIHHWRNTLLALLQNTNLFYQYVSIIVRITGNIYCVMRTYYHSDVTWVIIFQIRRNSTVCSVLRKGQQAKKTLHLLITELLWMESISDQWIPLTDGQLYGEIFHSLTLSRCLSSRIRNTLKYPSHLSSYDATSHPIHPPNRHFIILCFYSSTRSYSRWHVFELNCRQNKATPDCTPNLLTK